MTFFPRIISQPLYLYTMKRISFFIIGLAALLFFNGCSTEVDLNADYNSKTVVYGLLDPKADIQWIKINKTFLGDGNNLDYATIRDSSEYRWEEFSRLAVEMYIDGDYVTEFPLNDTLLSNKEINGIFYGPEQTVYYFQTPFVNGEAQLNEEATYRLVIDFVERPDVSAETNVVKTTDIGFISPQPTSTLLMASNQAGNAVDYKTVNIRFSTGENIKLYDFSLKFNYTEVLNGERDTTSIEYNLGSYKSTSTGGGMLTDYEYSGLAFFTFLGNRLEAVEGMRREIGVFDGSRTRCFDLRMSVANEDLATYIEVNSPVTGVIQERPTWSNIDNGIGLFASRSSVEVKGIGVTGAGPNGVTNIGNVKALCIGQYTNDLGFCDPNPSSDYTCN